MCTKEASTTVWNSKMMGCVSDIVVHSQQQPSKDQQCRFSASAANASDIYKRLCIIYFCDERDTTQVASITFAQEGIRLVNLSASGGDEALPTSVFLSRSMFVLYNVYPPEGSSQEVQILINFSTLMDFLECAMANVTHEDLVHPLHIVLDNWLYISLQRAPTIGDLDKAMSTSLSTAIQRFCLIPTDCLSGPVEDTQTVPREDDQLMRETDELMDNTILMLHPLNTKLLDPSCLLPLSSANSSLQKQQLAKAVPASRVPTTPKTPSGDTSPKSDGENAEKTDKSECDTPRKRLKTTSDQIQMLEDWFQKEPLPPRKLREEMVQKLDGTVSLRQLEVWFQNRRAKQKKAEAKKAKLNGGVGEVPSTTPPSSPLPSPPSTPSTPSTPTTPTSSLNGMAPNPSTLIPSSSPTITPRIPSRKKAKINSQGTTIQCSPFMSPTAITSSPAISSPYPISSSVAPSLAAISPLASPASMNPLSSVPLTTPSMTPPRPIAKIPSKPRSVSPVPQLPTEP